MKKISVIIPMYNGEAFIGQCVRSVTEQTYRNLEILVIDDGSSDNGIGICEELAASDSRIRLLRKSNGGVSSARNYGIDAADGEYVFFLDSDDAIHPCLLEEMMMHMEADNADLAFCGYKRLDNSRMAAVRENVLGEKTDCSRMQWLAADETGTEEWFHVKYTDAFSGIGGKLILREAIGNLRFDRELTNGEDTFFLYQLIRRQMRSVYCLGEWYYYRTHEDSVTNSGRMVKGKRYFESARRIRDSEYGNGQADYARRWEILVVGQIRRSYEALRREKAREAGDIREAMVELKQIAAAESRHPMFRYVCFSDRLLFSSCFGCYPLYIALNGLALWLTKGRSVQEYVES